MKGLAWEGRKLLALPALWVFLALCLAFNGLLMGTNLSGRALLQEASSAAQTLGQRVDDTFRAGLAQRPATQERAILEEATQDLENIYAGYDLTSLSTFYQDYVKSSPWAAQAMARKYDLLAQRVDHLAQTGAALDLCAGPVTHDSHQFLFGTLLRAVLGEGAILGMLITLYLLGYEHLHRAEAMAYTTRTGRGLLRRKLGVAAALSVALYVLLALVTLGVYFALWDYSGLWGASVSSQFNYLVDLMVQRPFLPWTDFTLAGYLAAFLALGGALVGACALLGGLCGCLVRGTYRAALGLILLCLLPLAGEAACAQGGLWAGYYALSLHPVGIWLNCNGWFTEGGLGALIPWQETASLLVAFLLLAAALTLALRHFRRKDLV